MFVPPLYSTLLNVNLCNIAFFRSVLCVHILPMFSLSASIAFSIASMNLRVCAFALEKRITFFLFALCTRTSVHCAANMNMKFCSKAVVQYGDDDDDDDNAIRQKEMLQLNQVKMKRSD